MRNNVFKKMVYIFIFILFCKDEDKLLNQIRNYPNQDDKLKAAEEFMETNPDFAKKILESIKAESVNPKTGRSFEEDMFISPYDFAKVQLKKIECYKKRGKDFRFKDLYEAKDFLLQINHTNIQDKMACGFSVGICHTDAGSVEIEPEVFASRVYAFRSDLKEGKYAIEDFGIMFNDEIESDFALNIKHGFFFSKKKDGYTFESYCSVNGSFDDILNNGTKPYLPID